MLSWHGRAQALGMLTTLVRSQFLDAPMPLAHGMNAVPAFKTMRAHNGCSRSRVWSLYTDSSAARDYEKGAVYCFRCHTAEGGSSDRQIFSRRVC